MSEQTAPSTENDRLDEGPHLIEGESPNEDDREEKARLDGAQPEDPDVQPQAEEPELDPEVEARRRAALARLRSFGDPALRAKARPIERFDDAVQDEIRRMGELMNDALGVGLAAPQVGVLNRVLVYRVPQQSQIAALINPTIEWTGRETETMEEGCLSLPSVLVDVERPLHLRVRALDEQGDEVLVEASGLEARVIQHEIDHLDGVLILDRTTRDQRKEAMRALREAQEAALSPETE